MKQLITVPTVVHVHTGFDRYIGRPGRGRRRSRGRWLKRISWTKQRMSREGRSASDGEIARRFGG